ncbi:MULTISPECIES: hypothetical protein [unclassified Streptomyces]|uniref:hypothetical protein n=1 Tax=unclassified Streptomyces TaxID=2593676 RepID=UPI00049033B2|nr:hypothetical protein [Streptomyces sp. 303MFCol5.2]
MRYSVWPAYRFQAVGDSPAQARRARTRRGQVVAGGQRGGQVPQVDLWDDRIGGREACESSQTPSGAWCPRGDGAPYSPATFALADSS